MFLKFSEKRTKNGLNVIFSWKMKKLQIYFYSLMGIVLSSLLFSCASIQVPVVEKISIERFEAYNMADGRKVFPKSAYESIPDADILEINQQVKSLLDDKVVNIRNPQKRLKKITKILLEKIEYDMVNDRFGSKTAQETFDTGTGNCLSFSNLFIAMTRYAGLTAEFQEIPTLPSWSREGELLFFTRHIGASVDIHEFRTEIAQIVLSGDRLKFERLDGSQRFFFTPTRLVPNTPDVSLLSYMSITDKRAFAQFYNNIGSKRLTEGDDEEAFRYFVKAIKTDPRLSYAWSNLGVVYRRNSQLDAALAAYFQGLAVTDGPRDTSIFTLMNNIANLYQIKGDSEKASFYEKELVNFREKNPYYKYTVARTAFLNSYYEMSIKRFKEAIRLKDDEHLFYYGLALAYIKTGDIKKAEENINLAIQYSWTDEKKAYYERVWNSVGDSFVN